jgi:hypothetical protein
VVLGLLDRLARAPAEREPGDRLPRSGDWGLSKVSPQSPTIPDLVDRLIRHALKRAGRTRRGPSGAGDKRGNMRVP